MKKVEVKVLEKEGAFECELFSLFITKHLISWLCTQFLYFFLIVH